MRWHKPKCITGHLYINKRGWRHGCSREESWVTDWMRDTAGEGEDDSNTDGDGEVHVELNPATKY